MESGGAGPVGSADAAGGASGNVSTAAYDPSTDPNRKAKSKDLGWKYAYWPDLTDKNMVTCMLCQKNIHGGIKRLKQHLAGGFGDVLKCLKTTAAISREMHEALLRNQRKRGNVLDDQDSFEVEQRGNQGEIPVKLDSVQQMYLASDSIRSSSKESQSSSRAILSFGTAAKRFKVMIDTTKRGPIDAFVSKSPEEVVAERLSKGLTQTTIENHLKGDAGRKKTNAYIHRWLYDAGIPFNTVKLRSFQEMIEAIGQHGPGLIPPTYHEVRGTGLQEEKLAIADIKKNYEDYWNRYGCTLISDGWTDKRGRYFINFLVNCPIGTYFMGSMDASSQIHDANMLFHLLDDKIEELGENNVVQVITDNVANYVAASRLLMQKRTKLYWTPCAAYCLDLMLEDISKLRRFKDVINKAKRITTFIYRHTWLLNAMRARTEGLDLVRIGITRFITSFLTLQSLLRHKDSLRKLFVSDEWKQAALSSTETGKKVEETVLSVMFWNGLQDCLRATQPLLVVLRLVDVDERPAIPEVYVAIEFAKQKIKENFLNRERLWKKVIDIVDRRWACQMDRPLYAAAFYLNASKYFEYIKTAPPEEICKLQVSFNEVITRLVPDENMQDKVILDVEKYRNCEDSFSKPMAIRQRLTMKPISWWQTHGTSTPTLQQIAIRILGLCCSASGCERNWSTFEFIHTKKRNRLEHQRLNDLVYIQYNRRLHSRFKRIREEGDNYDPLVLDELNWSSEWMTSDNEEDLVHSGDNTLTWANVDSVIGATTSLGGRNLPRRVATTTSAAHITYSRRRRVLLCNKK